MERLVISSVQKQFFKQHGFLVLNQQPIIRDKALIERLKQSFDRCFRGQFSTKQYPDEWHWRQGISKPGALREICNAWKSDREVQNVVLSYVVGSLGGQLFDHWDSARVGQDDLIWKVPHDGSASMSGTTKLGFHMDSHYISEQFLPKADNSITVWIALDDADETNGVVEYVAGSHRFHSDLSQDVDEVPETDPANAGFHSGTGEDADQKLMDELRRKAKIVGTDPNMIPETEDGDRASVDYGLHPEKSPDLCELVRPSVPAGCCLIHHQNTIHGSRMNISRDRHRRALAVHLIDGNVKFVEHPTYIYGRYKLAGSDELREEFFPTTWRRCLEMRALPASVDALLASQSKL